jgi:arsenite methyltransferase
MTATLKFSDEQARRFLSAGQRPERIARRKELIEALAVQSGDRVLDVGCGAGLLAAEIAALVGPAGRVEGVDISEDMLAVAQTGSRDQPFSSWIHFGRADAAELPFPDGSFDAVVSYMVYEYVAPIDKALSELRRVLRRGGRALVVDADSDSYVWHSSDSKRMERVLSAWEEHAAHPWLPRVLESKLRQAGFDGVKIEPHALLERDAGHHMIDIVGDFVPGRRGVTREEAQAWANDLHELGRIGHYFYGATLYWFMATVSR